MKRLLPLVPVLCLLAFAHAAPETAPAPKRTIAVSGCATGYIQPDAVLWTVVCEANGQNLLAAKENSEKLVKVLLDGCAKKGIQGADVSLGMIQIQDARAGQAETPQDSPERFTVTRTITIRQRELGLFHDMLALLGKGKGKVSYKMYCSRVDKITRDTLLRATQAAKDKAGAMAAALGSALGPVLTVSEFAPTNAAISPDAVLVDDSSPVFSADAQKLSVSVFATFELQ